MEMSVALVTTMILQLIVGAVWRLEAQLLLQVGFYDSLCPAAEIIVREEVTKAVNSNPGLAAGLLRLHFHDCFVRGCDASVLLDSTPSNLAEKDAAPNLSLRGFEVIDAAKSRLEEACYGVVSCADVLAFAARDSIVLAGGLPYEVPAGRRDGNISSAQETAGNLPPPNLDVNQLTQIFARKGFTQSEMVTLSGAHTIGQAHCSSFSNRLYNFDPTNSQDPSLDPSYVSQLKQQCPQGGASAMVPMDPITPDKFDANFYQGILSNRGLLTSDQVLVDTPATTSQVVQYAYDAHAFFRDFAVAMVKMGQMEVLTGNSGFVRTSCGVIN